MTTDDKAKRRKWTPEQTVAIVQSYCEIKEDFQHGKKKLAYEKILKDLIARGILDSSITEKLLENKMQSLLRAYRAGKFHPDFLGTIPYLKLIFGDRDKVDDSNEMSDDMTMDYSETSDYNVGEPSCHTLNLSGTPVIALDDGGVEAPNGSGENFLSTTDIKSEIRSRSASPNLTETRHCTETAEGEDEEMKVVAEELFYAEKLKLYKQKLKEKLERKQDYYIVMLEESERSFRKSEARRIRRHRDTMDFYKNLLSVNAD